MRSDQFPDEPLIGDGDSVAIAERVVVAPSWGRLWTDARVGWHVKEGMVIGRLRERGVDLVLVSPIEGTFVAWMALEGERVRPGTPVARLRKVARE